MKNWRINILLIFAFLFAGTCVAQDKLAPLPDILIVVNTNSTTTPITVVQTSKDVSANLTLTYMTAKSAKISSEQQSVTVVLREALACMPRVTHGDYEKGQKLQTITVGELSLSLPPTALIQINDQIFAAKKLPGIMRNLPSLPAKR